MTKLILISVLTQARLYLDDGEPGVEQNWGQFSWHEDANQSLDTFLLILEKNLIKVWIFSTWSLICILVGWAGSGSGSGNRWDGD